MNIDKEAPALGFDSHRHGGGVAMDDSKMTAQVPDANAGLTSVEQTLMQVNQKIYMLIRKQSPLNVYKIVLTRRC